MASSGTKKPLRLLPNEACRAPRPLGSALSPEPELRPENTGQGGRETVSLRRRRHELELDELLCSAARLRFGIFGMTWLIGSWKAWQEQPSVDKPASRSPFCMDVAWSETATHMSSFSMPTSLQTSEVHSLYLPALRGLVSSTAPAQISCRRKSRSIQLENTAW